MISFLFGLFRKDLPKILAIFDKAHAELDAYILRTTDSLSAAQAAADTHAANLKTASNVKANLVKLTSGAN